MNLFLLLAAAIVLILGGTYISYSKSSTYKEQENCFTPDNFQTVFHYLQWKRKTTKRLSPSRNVIFEQYELKADYEQGQACIRVMKKGYTHFKITAEKGIISLAKKKSQSTKKEDALFCRLLERAKFRAIPKAYTYHYVDGNNNLWKINAQSLEYIPVKPAHSSSGTYSGGEAFKITLSKEQFNILEEQCLFLLYDEKVERLEKRLMGSSKVSQMTTPTVSVVKVIIPLNAPQKSKLEKLLERYHP